MSSGFETVLEAEDPEDYLFVKEGIDRLNKSLNMDLAPCWSDKRSIYGKAGFDILLDVDV
ncbi:MAG: hypothetical protein ACLFVP_07475 [Candidatus Bathyarchaeia archaeon]